MPVRLFLAMAASALVALLLSLIPPAAWSLRQPDIPTFRQSLPVVLNEQNLVDLFTLSPTHYNIKRVTWENGSLAVDFLVPPSEHLNVSEIYGDWYRLTHRAFTRTVNVTRLSIRLWEAEGADKSRLLVTWQADRPNAPQSLPDPERVTDVRAFAEQTFSIHAAPEFIRKIRPPSQSVLY